MYSLKCSHARAHAHPGWSSVLHVSATEQYCHVTLSAPFRGHGGHRSGACFSQTTPQCERIDNCSEDITSRDVAGDSLIRRPPTDRCVHGWFLIEKRMRFDSTCDHFASKSVPFLVKKWSFFDQKVCRWHWCQSVPDLAVCPGLVRNEI